VWGKIFKLALPNSLTGSDSTVGVIVERKKVAA